MWTHRTSESLMLEKISKILKSNLWHQPLVTQSRALNATSSRSLTPLRPWAASSKFITKDRSSHLFQTPLFEDGNVPGSLWQNLSAVTHPTPEIVREVSPGEVCSCSGRQFITCRRNVTVYLVSAQIIHVSPSHSRCEISKWSLVTKCSAFCLILVYSESYRHKQEYQTLGSSFFYEPQKYMASKN